ncbi:MAG: helix-turn-helix domain-containing protein [Pseudomonadota bacterium]
MLQQILSLQGALWTTHANDQNTVLSRLEMLIAQEFSVSILQLRSKTRGLARVARARQIAMYMAHVALGFSLSNLAKYFGRDRTTITHACNLIEDARDERRFDEQLNTLEEKLLALVPQAKWQVAP